MSKRSSAKHKLDRRMGENIWGRPKSPINTRAYGPGQHGQRRKGKLSDFGVQLRLEPRLLFRRQPIRLLRPVGQIEPGDDAEQHRGDALDDEQPLPTPQAHHAVEAKQ